MTADSVSRRTVLRLTAAGLISPGLLTGCGGGSSREDYPKPPPPKPLLQFLDYSGNPSEPSVVEVKAHLDRLALAYDRFDQSALCYRFYDRTSVAEVRTMPSYASADFAISFWFRCIAPSTLRKQVLAAMDSAANPVLSLEFDGDHALAVYWNGVRTPLIAYGRPSELANAGWHHLLVQRDGALLQAFADGALVGEATSPPPSSNLTGLVVGASAWEGDIDQMKLHNTAFEPESVPRMVYAWQRLKPTTTADALAGYYPFNGDAKNDTGLGIDGILHDVQLATNRFGDADAAYAFDGNRSFIELDDWFDETLADFGWGMWFRSFNKQPMVALAVTAGQGQSQVDIVFNAGAAASFVRSGLSPKTLSFGNPGELADNEWHFLLVQRQAGILQMYVDGNLRASGPDDSVMLGRSARMWFGRSANESSPPLHWNGFLDDIQVYARAWSQAQIEALQSMQFRPRDGTGALTFKGQLWMLGGWNTENAAEPTTNEVWSSDDGEIWHLMGHAPWEGRHTAGHVVHDNRMWIIGGDKNRGYYQNDVWSSADGIHWDFITDTPPWAERATLMALAFKGRIWVLGGQQVFSGMATNIAHNDVYSSVDGKIWKLENSHSAWSPRGLILGSVVHRGRMWVIGGGQYDARTYLDDVWSSADGVQWDRVLEHAPWAPRHYHSITAFDDKIWVVAGSTQAHPEGTNDVWYSSDGVKWTQLKDIPWPARHATAVFVKGNTMWVAAGSSTRLYNDVWSCTYAP